MQRLQVQIHHPGMAESVCSTEPRQCAAWVPTKQLGRLSAVSRSLTDATIPLTRLAGETFILYGPPGTGIYDATIAACHAKGFNPRAGNLAASTQQAPRIASTLSLVSAGLGISCVPASLQRLKIDDVVY